MVKNFSLPALYERSKKGEICNQKELIRPSPCQTMRLKSHTRFGMLYLNLDPLFILYALHHRVAEFFKNRRDVVGFVGFGNTEMKTHLFV